MAQAVQIIGSYLSPYVRKVLVVLDLKGIGYEIDPIVPFFGDDNFTRISPVRRIPVLLDEQVTLADSSVICQYLEDRYPRPMLYPTSIVDRARARWLEEYADSRMGEVFIWGLFNQVAIKPNVWGEATDQAAVEKTLSEDMPQVLDYLEAESSRSGLHLRRGNDCRYQYRVLLSQRGIRAVSSRCRAMASHRGICGARPKPGKLREAEADRGSFVAHPAEAASSGPRGNGSRRDG